MGIQIRALSKRFGACQALHAIDLDIAKGELVALIGPSGCGKTTLLRLIAGLEAPDSGSICFGGADVSRLPARSRGVGFVFQHYALFRHMSVFENVAFGLRVRPRRLRPDAATLRDVVERTLKLVQLEGLSRRYPDQLSGGQRQRVALARALVIEPHVLLLDEPFGALDAKVRRELRRWLRRLHDELHVTSVFVTHDQDEAADVADRIVLLRQGSIEQQGSAESVYETPASAFVCAFMGEVNRLPGELGPMGIEIGSAFWPPPADCTLAAGPVEVCVRPHDMQVVPENVVGGLAGQIIDARVVAGRVHVELALQDLPGQAVMLDLPGAAPGSRRYARGNVLCVAPTRLLVFPREAEAG